MEIPIRIPDLLDLLAIEIIRLRLQTHPDRFTFNAGMVDCGRVLSEFDVVRVELGEYARQSNPAHKVELEQIKITK